MKGLRGLGVLSRLIEKFLHFAAAELVGLVPNLKKRRFWTGKSARALGSNS